LAGVSHRALLSLEHFLDAAGTRLSVNGRFKEETEHVTVSNSAHQHIDKNGLLIEMENEDDKGVKINVSGSLSRIMKANKIQHVEIQVIETRINPYFDDDSAILGTPVVSLQIKDGTYGQDRIPIMLTNISKPFELFLPLKESSQEAIDFSKVERLNVPILRSLEQFEDSDFVPIYIILGYNTRWKITVADHPLGIEFSVRFLSCICFGILQFVLSKCMLKLFTVCSEDRLPCGKITGQLNTIIVIHNIRKF